MVKIDSKIVAENLSLMITMHPCSTCSRVFAWIWTIGSKKMREMLLASIARQGKEELEL